jgi:hypothetical protein
MGVGGGLFLGSRSDKNLTIHINLVPKVRNGGVKPPALKRFAGVVLY